MPLDRAARNELVLRYAGWARKLALQTVHRRGLPIAPEDAIAAAFEALVRLADRHGSGAKFTTYAHQRIVGAVRDEAFRLSSGSGRDSDGVRRALPRLTDIDAVAHLLLGIDATEDAEARVFLDPLLAMLPAREREILRLCYVEELPLAEVGARFGFSESRVWQIRRDAIEMLRAVLKRRGRR